MISIRGFLLGFCLIFFDNYFILLLRFIMKEKELYKELNITYSFYSRFLKRFFDFMLALIALIILAIPLLIVYLLTIIFLGAPALYKQARPGKNHKVFYIYKFRSMNNKKRQRRKPSSRCTAYHQVWQNFKKNFT